MKKEEEMTQRKRSKESQRLNPELFGWYKSVWVGRAKKNQRVFFFGGNFWVRGWMRQPGEGGRQKRLGSGDQLTQIY